MRCNNFSFKCKATQKRHLVCCSFFGLRFIIRLSCVTYSTTTQALFLSRARKVEHYNLPALADWIRSADDVVEGAGDIFENGAFGVVLNSFGAWGGGDAGAGNDNCVDWGDFSCLISLISV